MKKISMISGSILIMLLILYNSKVREYAVGVEGYDDKVKIDKIHHCNTCPSDSTMIVSLSNGLEIIENHYWNRYKYNEGDSIFIRNNKNKIEYAGKVGQFKPHKRLEEKEPISKKIILVLLWVFPMGIVLLLVKKFFGEN